MERKAELKSLLSCALLLVYSFATVSHGGVDHLHAEEETMESTFVIDGDIIDCIDVYKQISFQHPLLVNHTIQMKPTHQPEKVRANDHLAEASTHPWSLPKSCPKGSIPIRRAKGNGPAGDSPSTSHSLLQSIGTGDQKDVPYRSDVHNTIQIITGDKYVGAKATMNVWNPKVQSGVEFSSSQVWVATKDKMVSMLAGWLVYPNLNGDDQTRFFIFWTTDGSKTFCYNLKCPGFVHTNSGTTIDTRLVPVSVYGGSQYAVDVEIAKDRQTGNWWVYLQGNAMGYWPKELVQDIAEGAGVLVFGGEATNWITTDVHNITEMGSGHFASEGFQKASFFKNVQVADTSYTYSPPNDKGVQVTSSCDCYDLQVGKTKDGPWGYFFFYGGPGTHPACRCQGGTV